MEATTDARTTLYAFEILSGRWQFFSLPFIHDKYYIYDDTNNNLLPVGIT